MKTVVRSLYVRLSRQLLTVAPVPQYQYISGLAEAPGAHEKFFTVFNFVTHPCSRGSMHIISADPAVSAMLDPRFWSHPFGMYPDIKAVS